MYQRLARHRQRAVPTARFPRSLLAVDDSQDLLGPAAAGSCGPARAALEELSVFGRAARVSLLIAAYTLYALPCWLLASFSTRIVLGLRRPGLASYLLGSETACQDVPDCPGCGTAVTGYGPPPPSASTRPRKARSEEVRIPGLTGRSPADPPAADPAGLLLGLVGSAIANGHAHLLGEDSELPDEPALFGWHRPPAGPPQAGGLCIGIAATGSGSGRRVYLFPVAAFTVAEQEAARLRTTLPVTFPQAGTRST